ncbi:hypothetical protein B9T25_07755 [Acinetobacter sp. ANC 4470]|nr:hypothetical protein B9T25_07755 [Acinetobacter sp. ANC 4470]
MANSFLKLSLYLEVNVVRNLEMKMNNVLIVCIVCLLNLSMIYGRFFSCKKAPKGAFYYSVGG